LILVDTSIWIDHFRSADEALIAALRSDQVLCHPLVIEELAAGNLARRAEVLAELERLAAGPRLSHREAMSLIEGRHLAGSGLSVVDIHLLGTALMAGARLWTRDRKLAAAALEHGVLVGGLA
jgi:predicted nucleic acid-binding protein